MPRKSIQAGPFVITANALEDGRVVYHGVDGRWAPAIGEAAIYHTAVEAAAHLESISLIGHSSRVIDPQIIAVTPGVERVQPDSLRERIRSLGPSQNWTKAEMTQD